jgi:hypothetical protein
MPLRSPDNPLQHLVCPVEVHPNCRRDALIYRSPCSCGWRAGFHESEEKALHDFRRHSEFEAYHRAEGYRWREFSGPNNTRVGTWDSIRCSCGMWQKRIDYQWDGTHLRTTEQHALASFHDHKAREAWMEAWRPRR